MSSTAKGETHSTRSHRNTEEHILENKSAIWYNFTIGVRVSFMVIHEYLRDGGAGGWGKGGFQGHILFCVSMGINISKVYD